MIKLTVKGQPVWVNPELIESVGHSDYYKGTVVEMTAHNMDETPLTVEESPEEVVEKILGYKLSMERHSACLKGVADLSVEAELDVYGDLQETHKWIMGLAGLEG